MQRKAVVLLLLLLAVPGDLDMGTWTADERFEAVQCAAPDLHLIYILKDLKKNRVGGVFNELDVPVWFSEEKLKNACDPKASSTSSAIGWNSASSLDSSPASTASTKSTVRTTHNAPTKHPPASSVAASTKKSVRAEDTTTPTKHPASPCAPCADEKCGSPFPTVAWTVAITLIFVCILILMYVKQSNVNELYSSLSHFQVPSEKEESHEHPIPPPVPRNIPNARAKRAHFQPGAVLK